MSRTIFGIRRVESSRSVGVAASVLLHVYVVATGPSPRNAPAPPPDDPVGHEGTNSTLRTHSRVAPFGPTTPEKFGAKYQACPHMAVRRLPASTWGMGVAETGATVRKCVCNPVRSSRPRLPIQMLRQRSQRTEPSREITMSSPRQTTARVSIAYSSATARLSHQPLPDPGPAHSQWWLCRSGPRTRIDLLLPARPGYAGAFENS